MADDGIVPKQVRLLKQGKPLDVQARTMLWNVYCYFRLSAERTKSTAMLGDAIEKTSLATGISLFTVRGIVLKGRQQLKEGKPLDLTFAPRKKRAIKAGPKIPRALYRSWRQARDGDVTELHEGDEGHDVEALQDVVGDDRLDAAKQLTIASTEHMSLNGWKELQLALRGHTCAQGFIGGREQSIVGNEPTICGHLPAHQRERSNSRGHGRHENDELISSEFGDFVLSTDLS